MKQRIFSGIIAIMIVITGMGVVNTYSNASTLDSDWTATLSTSDSSYKSIGTRIKDDYSYIYVYWSSKTSNLSALNAKVYGLYVQAGGEFECGSNNVGTQHTYLLSSTKQYSLTNYVKENGFALARVKIRSNAGSGIASGKWSPDSYGLYTILK